tara:strand:+ start:5140 stop:5316 length:177 start_codon:yes stop_codon:yes gene_type:complete
MVVVTPKYKDEPFEQMLRRFKKKVDSTGVIKEIYYRKYHRKPSLAKKEPKPSPWPRKK